MTPLTIYYVEPVTVVRAGGHQTAEAKLPHSSDCPPELSILIIIITRPKPAYGRQGLAGSWGQDIDEVSTFLVFLTSHFAPAALSSDLNQPRTINDGRNPPGIMKTRPGAIKTDLEQ